MTINVGSFDRIARIVLGLALLALLAFGAGYGGWRWAGLLGVPLLMTGLLRTCPAYSLLGMSTCPMRR